FNIAGYELGLDPNQAVTRAGRGGGVAYWRVVEIQSAVQHFVTAGAATVAPIQDVGEGIKVATVADPFRNLIRLIENPHFELPKAGVGKYRQRSNTALQPTGARIIAPAAERQR